MLSRRLATNIMKSITFRVDNHIDFRLYPDCRPYNLEISNLQKGLVLVLNEKELIEEGIGFGVPVVKLADKTFFSSSAQIRLVKKYDNITVFSKTFTMDSISRKRIWQGPFINDKIYSLFYLTFRKIYIKQERLRTFLNKVMELRGVFGINTQFIKVNPIGYIIVTYKCSPKKVEIQVNLSELYKEQEKEVFILNEQGSTYFQKYSDSNGLILVGREIGPWTIVDANEASLSDLNNKVKFTLRDKRMAKLFRGFEQTKGRFSWVGLSYSLLGKIDSFSYDIVVGE